MKKKLLSAAITSAIAGFIALPASADVKVGGHAQVEIANETRKSAAGAELFDGTTVEDNARGRFWITADEDLGSGMKGLALYEFKLDTTGQAPVDAGDVTKANQLNIREKYVGLQSGFGTIKLGSVRSPYKYAGGVLWDSFVTTNLEARGNGGMTGGVFGHNNFMDNSINYTTPTLGGLVISATYNPDKEATGASTTARDDYAASIEWKGAGLQVVAATAHDNDNAAANDVDAVKLGVRGDFGSLGVMVQAENVENDAGNIDDDTLFLGLQMKFGKVTGVVQLGKTEEGGTGANVDTDYLAAGAWYNFSKTFSAFGGYRLSDGRYGVVATTGAGQTGEEEVITLGLRKVF